MEKSCPGQEGHPPSRVNFSERLYEKKVDPFARAKSSPSRDHENMRKKKRLEVCKSNRLFFLSLQTLAFYTQEILVPMVFETELNNSEVKTSRAKSVCEGYTSRG